MTANRKKIEKVDLSVILTAHSEGVLIHKALLSVMRALKKVIDARNTYEVIIHVDNGTPATMHYLQRYHNKNYQLTEEENALKKHLRIFENSFGDPGLSRNFAIKKSNGKYIATIDADDLISENYFIEGLKILKKRDNEKLVLHPGYCISFWANDQHFGIQKVTSSVSRHDDACRLAVSNLWGVFAFAKRDVFLSFPYRATKNGIGYEDWGFNVDTINAGCKHDVIPDTIYFYRRKNNSWVTNSQASSLTIDYSALFDFDFILEHQPPRTMPEHQMKKNGIKYKIKSSLVAAYVKARNHKLGNALLEPISTIGKKMRGKKLVKSPGEVNYEAVKTMLGRDAMEEWKNLATIETCLFPKPERMSSVDFHQPDRRGELSNAYWQLSKDAKCKADYVFIVPWIVSGGADKLLINYLQAFYQINPKIRIAVITTLNSENEWKHLAPANTTIIEFGKITTDIAQVYRADLFTRLILQLDAKYLHNINSNFFYQWASSHKELIQDRFKVHNSIFGFWYNTDDPRDISDYADPNLVGIYDVVDKIFTDNTRTPERMITRDGFDRNKFVIEHQPAMIDGAARKKPTMVTKSKLSTEDGHKHVLWASRIGMEKNIETVVAIAKNFSDRKVVFDVFGRMEPQYSEDIFRNIPNIRYHGAYDGIESIDPSRFDCFLYTSLMDGMPNVLLEVAKYKTPIVSTGVGGIPDFIEDQKTGLLIREPKNAQEYIAALFKLLEDEKLASKLAQNAYKKLQEEFSWQNYIEVIKKDFAGLLG